MAAAEGGQEMEDIDINMGGNNNDNNNDNNNNNNNNRRSIEPPTSSPAGSLHGRVGRGRVGGGGRRGGGRGRAAPISAEAAEMQGIMRDEEGESVRRDFLSFLNDFKFNNTHYYIDSLEQMENIETTTLIVNWEHLRPNGLLEIQGNGNNNNNNNNNQGGQRQIWQSLADAIESEYYRFEPYLRQAVLEFVQTHRPNMAQTSDTNSGQYKEFYVSIANLQNPSKLRELTTGRIGQLCSFSGTVTRTTEVRPELVYGTFQCENCGQTVRNIKQQFKYSEPKRCPNQDCQQNKSWNLLKDKSKFVDWQKVRSQESSEDIPPGSMPRSIDVILRGDIVERAKPGENVTFTGTLIVVPNVGSYYTKGSGGSARVVNGRTQANGGNIGPNSGVTGLSALGVRELNYKMVFLANNVKLTDIHEEELYSGVSSQEREIEKISIINRIKNTSNAYEQLTNSIAPKIYGHDNIKKGILLMLFGGVGKNTKDGVKLRGDINICIIGDPSTAKSQFLKYVTRILPRTVYTSGKASTAAGLTAAVMRDSETGEFGIEAGALMLADKGVCCIDEFDKMDELDQAAIHEAMEQQTITITKAGIQATLNARASILAAANPINGRYDKSRPLRHNVSISAPIMSRFDLFFVIVDECDEQTDMRVAQHIVALHQGKEIDTLFRSQSQSQLQSQGNNGNNNNNNMAHRHTEDDIRVYINEARKLQPKITQQAHNALVKWYRGLRQKDQTDEKAYRITVRQLESLIRLSEALARVYYDEYVRVKYVREAGRLLQTSIISVEEAEISLFDEIDEMEQMEELEQAGDQDGTGTGTGAGVAGVGDQDTEMEEAEAGGAQDKTAAEPQQQQPQRQNMSYNEYAHLTHMMVYIIRHTESSVDDGITQAKLESEVWKEQSDRIDSDEVSNYQRKITMVIQRLIDIDHILLIRKRNKDPKQRVLMVHPNYDPESRNAGNQKQRSRSRQGQARQQQQQGQQQDEEEENNNENGNENGNGGENDDDTAVTTEITQ